MPKKLAPVKGKVRWIESYDLTDVTNIEESFNSEDAWTRKRLMRMAQSKDPTSLTGLVFEHRTTGEVLGYLALRVLKEGVQVLRIVVHSDWTRNKIGTRLLQYLIGAANPGDSVWCEIDERQYPLQLFFRSIGIQQSALSRGSTLSGVYSDMYICFEPARKEVSDVDSRNDSAK